MLIHGRTILKMSTITKNQTTHARNKKKHIRRQKLNRVNKKLKRSRLGKGPRQKNWTETGDNNWDELEDVQHERVMPRNENERRREVEAFAFQDEDSLNSEQATHSTLDTDQQRGLVIEAGSGFCRVDTGQTIRLCHLRGGLKSQNRTYTNVVAVGDEVIIREDETEEGVVEYVLPRRSVLTRPDVYHEHLQQVIVANVDQLLIVAAWREPEIWLELIDRYLIAAEWDELLPILCLNKTDLVQHDSADTGSMLALQQVTDYQAVVQTYQDLSYRVVVSSAVTGQGVDELRALLHNKTTVLAGLSGVGKSSLLTAIEPDFALRTGSVSETTGEGKHTTTQTILLRLSNEGIVIDTPGIREFGLRGLYKTDLAQFFPEMSALTPNCRFKNCAHRNEPKCAIKQAVEAGKITPSRYKSYLQIHDTLPNG